MSFRIETERLIVRPWTGDDVDGLRDVVTDPRVMRYVGDGETWSEQRIERFLSGQRDTLAREGFCFGALSLRDNGAVIGQAGLAPLGTTGDMEMGWWMGADHWNQGLATEASRGLLRFAFESAGLQRVVAIAYPQNRASRRVMEKLGMRFGGERKAGELGLPYGDLVVVLYCIGRRSAMRAGATSASP